MVLDYSHFPPLLSITELSAEWVVLFKLFFACVFIFVFPSYRVPQQPPALFLGTSPQERACQWDQSLLDSFRYVAQTQTHTNTNTHLEYRKYQSRSPDHLNLQYKMIKPLHVCVGTTVCSSKTDRRGSNRRNVPLFCSPSEGLCRLSIDYPSLSVKLRRPHLTPRSIFSIGISQPCFQKNSNLMLKQPFFRLSPRISFPLKRLPIS